MILSINQLKEKFKDYSNFYEKVKVEERNSNIIKIKRGLYSDTPNVNEFAIGNILLSPSYISFETALSFYGLIPERVNVVKSASFKKNKIKLYKTKFGTYIYQDINKKAYPYGIESIQIDNQIIFIASKEKALTDTLSVLPPRKNINDIKALLFDDLRINEIVFDELDKENLLNLCDLYPSTNCKLLKKYLRRTYD